MLTSLAMIFLELPVMAAYHRYYRKFGYTYHVLLQLESVVFKGKSLPNVSPLVDANFAAELETLILTAGHDVALLEAPVVIDVAREGDEIMQMSGAQKDVPVGDMLMRDAQGCCLHDPARTGQSLANLENNNACAVCFLCARWGNGRTSSSAVGYDGKICAHVFSRVRS